MTLSDRVNFRLLLIIIAILTLITLAGCEKKSSSKSAAATGGNGIGDPHDPGDNALALDMTWTVQSASASDLQWMADRIKQIAQYLWYATEGQLYLRNQTLKVGPGSYPDSIIIGRVFGAGGGYTQGYTTFSGSWIYITLQRGDGCAQVTLHELGHAVVRYSLSEEYDCLGCCMCAYVNGSGEGILRYCDVSTCTGSARFQCWNKRIREMHPDWTHPGPGGSCPTCNVTIQ